MTNNSRKMFFKSLAYLTLSDFFLILLLHFFPWFDPVFTFTISSLWLFAGLSLGVYVLYVTGAEQKSHAQFSIYIFGAMAAKFMVCVAGILIYFFLATQPSKYVILPYFIFYVQFTILETYFIVKVLHAKTADEK